MIQVISVPTTYFVRFCHGGDRSIDFAREVDFGVFRPRPSIAFSQVLFLCQSISS